ncbi:MAG: NAD-dependent epimerase/dehydratase family protein [Balneolales bacterium]
MHHTLITGCTGFVGKNLIDYLQQQNHFDITGITRNVEAQALPVNVSLKSYPALELSRETWDSYIHLAGMAHDVKGTTEEEAYFEVNYELTRKVFDRFLKDDRADKFIFLSSVKAVSDSPDGTVDEHVKPEPMTAYGRSKAKAEQYLLDRQVRGKDVYILRPCMIHGPGNKGNLNLLHGLIRRGIPWPLGSYENQRSFLSIDNLNFVIREILSGHIAPDVYHISDDEPLSTNELVGLIAKVSGRKGRILKAPKWLINTIAKAGNLMASPLNEERLQKLTESYVVSNAKLKKAIGKELPVKVRDGLARTLGSL